MKQAESYLRTVRRGLADAPGEDRERLMKRLTEAVSAYLEEEPEATEADIIRAFGKPEECAAELMEECDPTRVAAVRRKRRLRMYAMIAALALLTALILTALFLRSRTGEVLPESPSHGEYHEHGYGHH